MKGRQQKVKRGPSKGGSEATVPTAEVTRQRLLALQGTLAAKMAETTSGSVETSVGAAAAAAATVPCRAIRQLYWIREPGDPLLPGDRLGLVIRRHSMEETARRLISRWTSKRRVQEASHDSCRSSLSDVPMRSSSSRSSSSSSSSSTDCGVESDRNNAYGGWHGHRRSSHRDVDSGWHGRHGGGGGGYGFHDDVVGGGWHDGVTGGYHGGGSAGGGYHGNYGPGGGYHGNYHGNYGPGGGIGGGYHSNYEPGGAIGGHYDTSGTYHDGAGGYQGGGGYRGGRGGGKWKGCCCMIAKLLFRSRKGRF